MKKSLSSLLLRVVAIGAVLLAAVPAWAQGSGGAIKGEVVTTDDKPLESVLIRIESPEMQGVRQATTDATGRFRFGALPPGGYTLTAEKEGFKTVIRKGLVVQLGRTVPLKIVMDLPELGETVEVIERRPTVDTERSEVGQTLSDDFLGNLPTGRSFQEVIQFLPGVTGGGNPNIHGATSQSNQYFVDGVNTTDPVTNTFSMNFNFDAIKDIEVITAGLSVKYGSALGGIVNIVTKSGGNKFEGDFSVYYNTSALQSRDRFYTEDVTDFEAISAAGGLGGPIVKDKLWFYVSYQFERQSSLYLPSFDNGRDLARYPVPPTVWTSHYLLGKLTWQANDSHKVVISAQADPTRIENTISSIYTLPEADQLWDQGGYYVTGAWEWAPSSQVFFDTQLYFQNSYIDIQPITWMDCEERDEIGACLDADKQVSPVWSWTGAELDSGSMGWYYFDDRYNFTAQTDGAIHFDTKIGGHTLALGGGIQLAWTDLYFSYYTGEVLWKSFADVDGDGNPDPEEINDVGNYQNEQRAVVINDPLSHESGTKGWVYLEDEWQPFSNLTLQPGIRFDRSVQRNNLAEGVIDVYGFSPAFQFSWDPFRDSRTLVMGGYRHYVDTGFLAISSFLNASRFNAEYYEWDDTQHRWTESGRAQTPDGNITHFDIDAFTSDEFHFGVQREIQKDLSVEVQYIYRFFRGVWDDDEVNLLWNADGSGLIGTRSGDFEAYKYRLRTAQNAWRRYHGLEFTLHKNLSDNLEVFASYTWSRTTGNAIGGFFGFGSGDFDAEPQTYYQEGLLGIDRPHSVKLQAVYDNPNFRKLSEHVSIGWGLGMAFRFESGTPYDKAYYNTYYQGATDLHERRGTVYRLPATSSLDLRALGSITIWGTEIDLIVQVFNVLNSREIIGVYTTATDETGDVATDENGDSVFGQPFARQTPRTVQFGLRFQF